MDSVNPGSHAQTGWKYFQFFIQKNWVLANWYFFAPTNPVVQPFVTATLPEGGAAAWRRLFHLLFPTHRPRISTFEPTWTRLFFLLRGFGGSSEPSTTPRQTITQIIGWWEGPREEGGFPHRRSSKMVQMGGGSFMLNMRGIRASGKKLRPESCFFVLSRGNRSLCHLMVRGSLEAGVTSLKWGKFLKLES